MKFEAAESSRQPVDDDGWLVVSEEVDDGGGRLVTVPTRQYARLTADFHPPEYLKRAS